MNILIVGATRGIGRQLLEQSLTSGHTVTALVRNPQKLATQHARLRVIKGDILDSDSVAACDGRSGGGVLYDRRKSPVDTGDGFLGRNKESPSGHEKGPGSSVWYV